MGTNPLLQRRKLWQRKMKAATQEALGWKLKQPDCELWFLFPPPAQLRRPDRWTEEWPTDRLVALASGPRERSREETQWKPD